MSLSETREQGSIANSYSVKSHFADQRSRVRLGRTRLHVTSPMNPDDVFRLIDREVWIVTSAAKDGRRGGLVATWVSQASIDSERPVVVAGIAPNHFTAELIESSGGFVAHLINAENSELAWRFGLQSGRDTDKFQGLKAESTKSGLPILENSLAWLECRVITKYDTGDRWFYWADVADARVCGQGQPLRERDLFAAANAQQRAALAASRLADMTELRPAGDRWREKI
jgi:flavin reductase (DIM6/NTAB) family NADH-FMN oxidoreductase RutF